jgi:hypothetical protein
MENQKYGKERTIRLRYRRMGRRRTYIQRRLYEMGNREWTSIHAVANPNLLENDLEEDLVRSTLSTSFGRSRFFIQRRGVWLVCRTRIPGRFHHERQKRYSTCRRVVRVRGTRSWKWYKSEVDVNRTDRRRSLSFFIPLLVLYGRDKRIKTEDVEPLKIRIRRIWIGVGRYKLRIPDRRERSNRRSRRRTTICYLGCIERWRRRRYRKNGRKRKRN